METVGEVETSGSGVPGVGEEVVGTNRGDELVLQCPSPYSDISDRSMSGGLSDKPESDEEHSSQV